jgi:ankyrin repeat protein
MKGSKNYIELFSAISRGETKKVKELLKLGVTPNPKVDKYAESPLFAAVCMGHTEVCKILLENGADPNWKNSLGYTPLHIAAYHSKKEVCELLINHGANIHTHRGEEPSPLELNGGFLKSIIKSSLKKKVVSSLKELEI